MKVEELNLEKIITENDKNKKKLIKIEQEKIVFQEKLVKATLEKVKINNKLQEIKGNVRVYCRIRKMLRNQIRFHNFYST